MIKLPDLLLGHSPGESFYTAQPDKAVHTAAARLGVSVRTARCAAVPLSVSPDTQTIEAARLTYVTILED